MDESKLLRVSQRTHVQFTHEAERRGLTVDDVAAQALRTLRQTEMGEQLSAPLRDDEQDWLEADLG